jgi:hypothetical protein
MCARENLAVQLKQRPSSRRWAICSSVRRVKRAPDGGRTRWPGGGAGTAVGAGDGAGVDVADEDDAYGDVGARTRCVPRRSARGCWGGVMREQAALEGAHEAHGVLKGHRSLQLDVDA